MNILALDLGTKCGWATNQNSGVWNLKPTTNESAGRRYTKFRTLLLAAITTYKIDLVAFEEVHMHIGVDAAHCFGGLRAIMQTVCLDLKVEYQGVPVGTIKKHATGKGNAKKDQMILAATKLYPSVNVIDDNHADALCLLNYATKNFIY